MDLTPKESAQGDDYRGTDTVAVSTDNCVLYHWPYSADPNITYTPYCIKWRDCGSERVDDIVSGDIAGEETSGKYRSYLDQTVVAMQIDFDMYEAGLFDFYDVESGISDLLLTQGLGERPGDDLIPVFYWCADYGEDAGVRVFDPVDVGSVSFGWDLTYGEVYDIPGAIDNLYTLLQARLDLYNPEIGLVPKSELGFTYVQWPTWMFLQNPSEDITLFAHNSTDTLRIDLRATLVGVDWQFGDELVEECTAEEMLPFTEGMDPIADLPDCHHIFTQLDCQDLTATTRFTIEQMVRTRPSATNHEYPPAVWTDFLDTPTELALTSVMEDFEIHQILSLNVAQGLSREEVLERARASGLIPRPDEACRFLAARAN